MSGGYIHNESSRPFSEGLVDPALKHSAKQSGNPGSSLMIIIQNSLASLSLPFLTVSKRLYLENSKVLSSSRNL